MSIPVEIERLRAEGERYGPSPYLLTTGDDGRPHSVSVSARWAGEMLVVDAIGRRTAANVAARNLVSLLWPPHEPGGYSLIVDGDGALEGDGAGVRVVVRPTRGVLHRPAAPGVEIPEGCSADCRPLLR